VGDLYIFAELNDDSGDDVLCPCGQPNNHENMIGCDSMNCSMKWYHFLSAGIDNTVPEGKWLCVSCRKIKDIKVVL